MLMFFIFGMNMNIVRLAACQTLYFKLTHIEQQFKRHIGVGCFDDACLGDDLPDEMPRRLKLHLIHQIDFIEDDDIGHADLMDGQHLMALVEAQDLFGIDHGQDAVELHALDRPKRKRDFEWI